MDTLYIGHDAVTAGMKVLFSEQDFVNLVREKMGNDSAEYIQNIMTQRDEAARNTY